MNYHVAKKHKISRPSTTFKCKLCHGEFPGFYALRQHKNTQQGTQIVFGASNIDVEDILGDLEDHRLREEMEFCKHFLVNSEIENARHKVFNYALENLNAEIIDEKLDHFFNDLKCAAKVNVAFGFNLKNLEDAGFRLFYAHENNTLLDRSKLVCTGDNLAELEHFSTKLTSKSLVAEKEQTQSGGSTS